jgi:hypothetical protein
MVEVITEQSQVIVEGESPIELSIEDGQQVQVVTEESTPAVELSPPPPACLEIWQPGMAPGGKTGDLLTKSSDQDYDSEWTDQPIVDKLRFDLDAVEAVGIGELAWNADEGTLELGKNGVSNYLGQETMVLCRNASNTIVIPKGTAVMFAGAVGASGRIKVAPMIANGSLPGYVFFGVADQDILGASDGYVTVFGKIRGINTSTYVDGDILWCNPAVPGGFTKTEPQAPNLKLAVAAVVSARNNGTIFVRWTTGARLQDLHDVEANGTKDDQDILHWKASNQRWEPTSRLTLLEQKVAALETAVFP